MRLLLAGGSGLVGSCLVKRLADRDICLIGRRPLVNISPHHDQLTAPVAQWPSVLAEVRADVALCALGTTMAKAGSRQAFAAIDLDAVVLFATVAKACGVRQCLLVSSMSADPASANFYLSIKGQAEAALAGLGFDRLDIFRPGLLRGQREADRRIVERAAILISPLVDRLIPAAFDRYRSIAADDVAAAMVAMIDQPHPGHFVHHNREMLAAARHRANGQASPDSIGR